jgi:peptidoglycan hydrolase-like protein with peptidoglycan-binding domain
LNKPEWLNEDGSRDPKLEDCFDGVHPIFQNEPDQSAVQKIQKAIIRFCPSCDLGKAGPDGKFGPKTAAAVAKFKQNHGIFPADGVVGRKTMEALDALLSQQKPSEQSVDTPKSTKTITTS